MLEPEVDLDDLFVRVVRVVRIVDRCARRATGSEDVPGQWRFPNRLYERFINSGGTTI